MMKKSRMRARTGTQKKQHGNESAGESGWKRNENERLYADARQDETERRHVKGSRYESDSRQPHEAGRIGGESSDEKICTGK